MAVRILWASPLPPTRSGVSDYAVELLEVLVERAVVRIVEPPPPYGNPELPPSLAGRLVPTDVVPEAGEIVLAHFGNNPYHDWIADRFGGENVVAVVHDQVLHHLLVHRTLVEERSPVDFERLLRSSHGDGGGALARARRFGLGGRLDPFFFPALDAVIQRPRALICHSRFGLERLRRYFPGRPVLFMDLPAVDPGAIDRGEIRRTLGIGDLETVAMHLGFLTPEKGVVPILEGLAAARSTGADVRLLMVGDDSGAEDFRAAVKRIGIEDIVGFTGWLDWGDMIRVPAAADLGIVLRVPSAGETSAAVVRFLACGTPVAVNGLPGCSRGPPRAPETSSDGKPRGNCISGVTHRNGPRTVWSSFWTPSVEIHTSKKDPNEFSSTNTVRSTMVSGMALRCDPRHGPAVHSPSSSRKDAPWEQHIRVRFPVSKNSAGSRSSSRMGR